MLPVTVILKSAITVDCTVYHDLTHIVPRILERVFKALSIKRDFSYKQARMFAQGEDLNPIASSIIELTIYVDVAFLERTFFASALQLIAAEIRKVRLAKKLPQQISVEMVAVDGEFIEV